VRKQTEGDGVELLTENSTSQLRPLGGLGGDEEGAGFLQVGVDIGRLNAFRFE
jgi:hypothetical protein